MDLVIRNVRLIDGTGADPLSQVSVEVTGGRISWLGEETARPRRTVHQEDINGRGLTLGKGHRLREEALLSHLVPTPRVHEVGPEVVRTAGVLLGAEPSSFRRHDLGNKCVLRQS